MIFLAASRLILSGSHNLWFGVGDERAAPFFNDGVGCLWRTMCVGGGRR